MFTAPYQKAREGNPTDGLQLDRLAEWSDGLGQWQSGWDAAREDSTTVRLGRN